MTGLLLVIIILSLPLAVWAEDARQAARYAPEMIYIVNDYRFDPGDTKGDPETGLSLCGTRCNAISTNYRHFMEVGGWRIRKVSSDKELVVALNNPFLEGRCTCIADEYEVKIDDRRRGDNRGNDPVFQDDAVK